MKRYVAGFMFDERGSGVALVLKNRPAWQAGKLNAIGGHIEEAESPIDAMVREFHEEAGILHPKPLWQPLVRLYRPGAFEVYFYSTRTNAVYDCKSMTDEPVAVYDVCAVPLLELVPSVRWMMPMALDPNLNRMRFIEIEDVRGN